ncbi:MAG: lipoyl(octanoyl) transferase LipB [Flavobacteriales bacterium]|nr:lipoyl(octanoyl) transferase LipB [Flavobacteriales bacterium]
MESKTREIKVEDLGLIDYQTAWDKQKEMVIALQNDESSNTVLLCEHNHVYTFGKSANRNNLLINDSFLNQIGAQKFEIERGGDITYHGPGQLVGYPILNLHQLGMGVKKYVDVLEESIIETLLKFNIKTERMEGLTGIWLTEGLPRKIAAIGIKVSRGITMHGFALNVNTDLSYFNHMIPCGIADKGVTSMQKELHRAIEMKAVKEAFAKAFLKNIANNNF